jgi:hypothetical protein
MVPCLPREGVWIPAEGHPVLNYYPFSQRLFQDPPSSWSLLFHRISPIY